MQGIEGKTALVTGGAASIGRDIVEKFHAMGANVLIVARSEDKGRALAKSLGKRALFVRTDIRSDDALKRCVAAAVEGFGGLDFVVNNACSYADSGQASTREQWAETLDTNVVSGAMLAEIARPHLAMRRGAIVNLTSISAYAAQTGRWTYPVSKAAIVHLTRLQALDYAKDSIRANALLAGWTWSDPIEGLSGGDRDKADAVGAEFHILGRVGRGSEVADGVAFLCSDHASFITGSELRVEGGYLAMGPEQAAPAIAKLTGGAATVR